MLKSQEEQRYDFEAVDGDESDESDSVDDVFAALKDAGLEQYSDVMKENGFQDMGDWDHISSEQLKHMGWKAGHITKFRRIFQTTGRTVRARMDELYEEIQKIILIIPKWRFEPSKIKHSCYALLFFLYLAAFSVYFEYRLRNIRNWLGASWFAMEILMVPSIMVPGVMKLLPPKNKEERFQTIPSVTVEELAMRDDVTDRISVHESLRGSLAGGAQPLWDMERYTPSAEPRYARSLKSWDQESISTQHSRKAETIGMMGMNGKREAEGSEEETLVKEKIVDIAKRDPSKFDSFEDNDAHYKNDPLEFKELGNDNVEIVVDEDEFSENEQEWKQNFTQINWQQYLKDYGLEAFVTKFEEEGLDAYDDWEQLANPDLKELGFGRGHLGKWRRMMRDLAKGKGGKKMDIGIGGNKEPGTWEQRLIEAGLGQYVDIFRAFGFEDVNDWTDISDEDFEKMNFKRGHIHKFQTLLDQNAQKNFNSPKAEYLARAKLKWGNPEVYMAPSFTPLIMEEEATYRRGKYTVDSCITAYNEGEEIIIASALALGLSKLSEKLKCHRIWICDDKPSEHPYIRKYAEYLMDEYEFECHYFSRKLLENNDVARTAHGKSFNLNTTICRIYDEKYGEAMTNHHIITVTDCDHISLDDYISRIVPFFEDRNVALVQTPHHYYNVDNNKDITQSLSPFWHLSMLPVRARWSSVMCCGTNFGVRSIDLWSVGLFPLYTSTEDTALSLELLTRKREVCFLFEYTATGQSPTNLDEVWGQRTRWFQGNMTIFLDNNPCCIRELSIMQKLILFLDGYNYVSTLLTVVFATFIPIAADFANVILVEKFSYEKIAVYFFMSHLVLVIQYSPMRTWYVDAVVFMMTPFIFGPIYLTSFLMDPSGAGCSQSGFNVTKKNETLKGWEEAMKGRSGLWAARVHLVFFLLTLFMVVHTYYEYQYIYMIYFVILTFIYSIPVMATQIDGAIVITATRIVVVFMAVSCLVLLGILDWIGI